MNAGQRALQFSCHGQSLVGIIDVPERPLQRGVLVVSCAAQYRVGGHRHSTLMARLLAPRGIPVMRFDCRGSGDSDGEAQECAALAEDIGAAIDEFCRQMPESNEVVLWGVGDGASAAALYAPGDRRVRGLVLLNPWDGSDKDEQSLLLPHALARLGEIGFWKKISSRHAGAVDASLPLAQRMLASLASFDGAALLMVGEAGVADHRFAALADAGAGAKDGASGRVTLVAPKHAFATRAWRDEVSELGANWIVSW